MILSINVDEFDMYYVNIIEAIDIKKKNSYNQLEQ